MKDFKEMLDAVSARLSALARGNATVGPPISAEDRHVLPVCELSLSFGGGGGSGEERREGAALPEQGSGQGAGGGARSKPVAVVIVDNGDVKVECLY